MTKAWPRNTLCSAPDWASKARARASPQPVNTVNTARRWAARRSPAPPPGRRGAGARRGGRGGHPPQKQRPPQGRPKVRMGGSGSPLKGRKRHLHYLSGCRRFGAILGPRPPVCSRLCRALALPALSFRGLYLGPPGPKFLLPGRSGQASVEARLLCLASSSSEGPAQGVPLPHRLSCLLGRGPSINLARPSSQ